MKRKKGNKVKPIAYGGIFAGLSFILLYLANFMPMTYFWIMSAGVALAILANIVETKYTFASFISVCLLSFFFNASLFITIEFVLFYGVYSALIRPYIHGMSKSKHEVLLFKGSYFILASIMMIFVGMNIRGANALQVRMMESGQIFMVIFVLINALTYFAYDYFISGISRSFFDRIKLSV
jgi:hypothetical protein